MASVEPNNRIILDDFFSTDYADTIVWDHQLSGIFPKQDKKDSIYSHLKECRHVSVFKKEEVPERFHYRDNRRIPAIICLADEGWVIMSRAEYEKKQTEKRLPRITTGAHGYDNLLPAMQALFLARGPAFKKGLVIDSFENIQLYNMMTQILHITPAPNDGTFELANRILKQK